MPTDPSEGGINPKGVDGKKVVGLSVNSQEEKCVEAGNFEVEINSLRLKHLSKNVERR